MRSYTGILLGSHEVLGPIIGAFVLNQSIITMFCCK